MPYSTIIVLKHTIVQVLPLISRELGGNVNIYQWGDSDWSFLLSSALSLLPSQTWSETSPVQWQDGTTWGELFKNMQPSLTLASVPDALTMAAPCSQGLNVCVFARAAPMARTVRDAPRITNLVSVSNLLGGRKLSLPKGILGWLMKQQNKTKIVLAISTLCKFTRKLGLEKIRLKSQTVWCDSQL